MMLEINNLYAEIEKKDILNGLDLKVSKGSIHALMGPNGSGKSTLANVVMGNPRCNIIKGDIFFNGVRINNLPPDERAKLGLFMSFQYPSEIDGVTISNFLRTAYKSLYGDGMGVLEFRELLDKKLKLLKIPETFSERYLNQGFSGGEKKKSEILQLAILNPKMAILDETDSGLDIDALRIVARGINIIKEKNPDMTILIITHYKRILDFVIPDKVSIMRNGKIVFEGGKELVDKLEERGYGWIEAD